MEKSVSLKDVYELIENFREEVREVYVTKAEFLPVKIIAFGIVAAVTGTVLTALLARVVSAGFVGI